MEVYLLSEFKSLHEGISKGVHSISSRVRSNAPFHIPGQTLFRNALQKGPLLSIFHSGSSKPEFILS